MMLHTPDWLFSGPCNRRRRRKGTGCDVDGGPLCLPRGFADAHRSLLMALRRVVGGGEWAGRAPPPAPATTASCRSTGLFRLGPDVRGYLRNIGGEALPRPQPAPPYRPVVRHLCERRGLDPAVLVAAPPALEAAAGGRSGASARVARLPHAAPRRLRTPASCRRSGLSNGAPHAECGGSRLGASLGRHPSGLHHEGPRARARTGARAFGVWARAPVRLGPGGGTWWWLSVGSCVDAARRAGKGVLAFAAACLLLAASPNPQRHTRSHSGSSQLKSCFGALSRPDVLRDSTRDRALVDRMMTSCFGSEFSARGDLGADPSTTLGARKAKYGPDPSLARPLASGCSNGSLFLRQPFERFGANHSRPLHLMVHEC